MQRRSFLALLAASPALAQLLVACGDDTPGTTQPNSTQPNSTQPGGTLPAAGGRASLRSDTARATDGAHPAPAAPSVNAFAAAHYDLLL